MFQKISIISITLFCGLLALTSGQTCNTCMATNEAYCVDETTFYLCQDGNPLTATLKTCPNDYVCTDSENICEPRIQTDGSATVTVCSTTCGKCPVATAANKWYTCLSKTQFGRCVNDEVAIVSTCAADTYCNGELYEMSGKICAPQVVIEFFEFSSTCSNDEILTTTTPTTTPTPATTPSSEDLKAQCKAAQVEDSKFFYVINSADTECKSYILCMTSEDNMNAILRTCESGYYDNATNKCVVTKPVDCNKVAELSTTTESVQTEATQTEMSETEETQTEASQTESSQTELPLAKLELKFQRNLFQNN